MNQSYGFCVSQKLGRGFEARVPPTDNNNVLIGKERTVARGTEGNTLVLELRRPLGLQFFAGTAGRDKHRLSGIVSFCGLFLNPAGRRTFRRSLDSFRALADFQIYRISRIFPQMRLERLGKLRSRNMRRAYPVLYIARLRRLPADGARDKY